MADTIHPAPLCAQPPRAAPAPAAGFAVALGDLRATIAADAAAQSRLHAAIAACIDRLLCLLLALVRDVAAGVRPSPRAPSAPAHPATPSPVPVAAPAATPPNNSRPWWRARFRWLCAPQHPAPASAPAGRAHGGPRSATSAPRHPPCAAIPAFPAPSLPARAPRTNRTQAVQPMPRPPHQRVPAPTAFPTLRPQVAGLMSRFGQFFAKNGSGDKASLRTYCYDIISK